ncbi:NnrS family protein [Ruegeria arenilitoris]|uniref:NnrS family protein n=1 Tax=Ruegeria arenilitoris TaxID=1173585 RepID=UPI0014811DE2|nr:NnrS family protein [Ruegeria arenilitoris]
MPSAITRVMGEGFRVFFLFAGLYGVFAGLAWGGWLATLAGLELWTEAPYAMSPPMWHAHEMIFGYASAALGGFFLTAVPNWTGAPEARRLFIAAAAALWLAGRVALWFSGVIDPVIVAVLDLAFVPVLAAKIATQLIRRPKPQNMIFLLLLAYIWVSNLLTHLDWIGVTVGTLDVGLRTGLLALCSMIAILGGRITPAFTRNAMKREGVPEADWPVSRDWMEKSNMVLALLLPAVMLIFGAGHAVAILALVLGAIQGLRLSGWRGAWALRQPILFALHLALGMLGLGLVLWGMSLLGFGSELGALHVLGIGCVGGMTLAVMSRAALGHSGRALVAPAPVVVAYAAMALAAILRWLGSGLDAQFLTAMLVADGLWISAMALYVVAMWPALVGPRAVPS